MRHFDELPSLRLQPSSRKILIPFDINNKRKGAAIMLLSSDEETSYKMMNLPYIYNPQYFISYYMDRKVDNYIGSNMNKDIQEFIDSQNEAMLHNVEEPDDVFEFGETRAIKFDYTGGNSLDIRQISEVYNTENFNYWCDRFKLKKADTKINVYIYTSIEEFEDFLIEKNIQNGNKYIIYSYTEDNNIYLLSRYAYKKHVMDGPYSNYALNELISYIINKKNPDFNPYARNYLAIAASGQYEYFSKNKDFLEKNDENNLKYSKIFYDAIKRKAWNNIHVCIMKNSIGPVQGFVKKNVNTKLQKWGAIKEEKLSAEDRKNIKDSDYGLPEDKKYPMPDESHVRSAIRFFNHVDPSKEKELAKNINKKIKQYGMKVSVGKDNRFSKYYNESSLNENWIINRDDIYTNFNLWTSKKTNILYITGLSGSGKSTLAKQLAQQYNAEYIELDLLTIAQFKNDKGERSLSKMPPTLLEYWNSTDNHRTIRSWNEVNDITMETNQFNSWMIKNHLNDGKLYVIEGVQVAICLSPQDLVHYPLIIKGTSNLVSLLRRGKRRFNRQRNKEEDNTILKSVFAGINAIKNGLKNDNLIRNELQFQQFEDVYNSYLNESVVQEYGSFERSDFGDVLKITNSLNKHDFGRVCYSDAYKNSPFVIHREFYRELEPIAYVEVYQFPSTPKCVQLTAAVKDGYRGKGIMPSLVNKILQSDLAERYGIEYYIWNVAPDNYSSIRVAEKCGFINSGKTNKHGCLTYVYPVKGTKRDFINYMNKKLSEKVNLSKDNLIHNENYIGGLNENGELEIYYNIDTLLEDTILSEAPINDQKKIKKFLYQDRIRTNNQAMEGLKRAKKANPNIKKVFLKLDQYKGLNLYIDMSYYHKLFLKNNTIKLDRGIQLYFDFLNKMINNPEYKEYKKKTIFIPLFKDSWGPYNEDIYDYRKRINPLSLIFRLMKKNPDSLKKAWGNKTIVFLGDNGYFKVDFNTLTYNKLNKFKKNCDKLLSNTMITNRDIEEDSDEIINDDVDSKIAITTNIIDRIEKSTNIRIDNIVSGVPNDSVEIGDHLRIRDIEYRLEDDKKSLIAIMAPDNQGLEDIMKKNVIKNSNKIDHLVIKK